MHTCPGYCHRVYCLAACICIASVLSAVSSSVLPGFPSALSCPSPAPSNCPRIAMQHRPNSSPSAKRQAIAAMGALKALAGSPPSAVALVSSQSLPLLQQAFNRGIRGWTPGAADYGELHNRGHMVSKEVPAPSGGMMLIPAAVPAGWGRAQKRNCLLLWAVFPTCCRVCTCPHCQEALSLLMWRLPAAAT